MKEYDYIVINDDIESCVDTINSIIVSNKCLKNNNLGFMENIKQELKAL